MVFSSVPSFLDHHNWHPQLQITSDHQQDAGENPNLPHAPPLLSHPDVRGGGAGGGGDPSARPGSIVDRARMLNLPIPEPGINCPRCHSNSTKFCYYNNYNPKQPRYFCKTCRRYWTLGGTLRNVPVGGGCRKNKRNNRNKSTKSPSQTKPKYVSDSPSRCSTEVMASTQLLPSSLQLPLIMSSSGQFQHQNGMGSFQLGSGSSTGNNFDNISSTGGVETWRLPFLAGFEVPGNPNSGIDNTQIDPSLKIENSRGLNLSRQFLGVSETTNQQPWVGNAWTQFAGVNSTSSTTPTTHFL